jgi:hypothetical protein
MATCGERRRAITKSGDKKVAPPIPALLAMEAITIAIGNRYRYSIDLLSASPTYPVEGAKSGIRLGCRRGRRGSISRRSDRRFRSKLCSVLDHMLEGMDR